MKHITWHIEKRKVADLTAADYNPRKLTALEKETLKKSIDSFGAVEPGVVNIGSRKNVLIGGHQRRMIYEEMKREEMDVMVPDRELTDEEEKELNLRLNKNTGSWDQEKLQEMGIDLLLEVGFGEEELAGMFDDVDVIDDQYNLSKALKDITKPITKAGDVWKLGEHRLMVGDSLDPLQVEKLMGGVEADMIFCDPVQKKKEKEYAVILDGTITNALAHSKPNVHVFYWCDEAMIWMIQEIYRSHGIDNKRVCIWVKNNLKMTPNVAFNKAYEPCVYGTRGTPFLNPAIKNLNEVLNKEVESGNQTHSEILDLLTLWIVKRNYEQEHEYPSEKPVTLSEKPLKRCTGPGNVVLDLFGGTGTTLIACQQLARKCRVMEIDPMMATIIIDRWEKFSNQKAKRV